MYVDFHEFALAVLFSAVDLQDTCWAFILLIDNFMRIELIKQDNVGKISHSAVALSTQFWSQISFMAMHFFNTQLKYFTFCGMS